MTRGVDVSVNVFCKHSRVKQHLKQGRAWRIQTVINAPNDLRVQRRLHNLGELQTRARTINRRILHVQHAGQGCAIRPTLFERIQQPYTSGSNSPTHGRANEPERCASGTHAPWPWPAPCA